MYRLRVTVLDRKGIERETQEFMLGEFDTEEYNEQMDKISDLLYNMDLDFDEIEGDGDMAVDDLLISISDEEEVEKNFKGKRKEYRIQGREVDA